MEIMNFNFHFLKEELNPKPLLFPLKTIKLGYLAVLIFLTDDRLHWLHLPPPPPSSTLLLRFFEIVQRAELCSDQGVLLLFKCNLFLGKCPPCMWHPLPCLCPVLTERPDGEDHRNVSGAQLHRQWTDITRWQMLQCLPRYVFPLTALFSVVWITLWTHTQQSPATARSKHILPAGYPFRRRLYNNSIFLPFPPGMNASWLG